MSAQSPLTISIAMCTYNGARFLPEQLDCLAKQSRLPDEVVICDDCSSDNTADILNAWSKSVPFSVKIVQNEKNLGYAQNFAKAISLCSSDVIFLSDQDDIWTPDKLEKMTSVFNDRPEVGAVFCDGLCVDSEGNSLNRLVSDIAYPGMLYGRPYYLYWKPVSKGMHFFGCCCAIRKSVWDKIAPLPESFTHDLWIFLTAQAISEIVYLPDTMTHYRLHENNTSAVSPDTTDDMTGEYIQTFYKTATGLFFYNHAMAEDFQNWLEKQERTRQTAAALAFLKLEDRHFNNRSRCQRNIWLFSPLWIWEIVSGGYFRRLQPIQSIAYDFRQGLCFWSKSNSNS